MKTGSSLFDTSRFTVQKARGSERGELLDKFLARLNPPRQASGYKPYTHARLSLMLQHLKTDELYPFYRQCEQAGIPFSAFFHWSLKPKPKTDTSSHAQGGAKKEPSVNHRGS